MACIFLATITVISFVGKAEYHSETRQYKLFCGHAMYAPVFLQSLQYVWRDWPPPDFIQTDPASVWRMEYDATPDGLAISLPMWIPLVLLAFPTGILCWRDLRDRGHDI